jgi:hypothetical protein
MPIWLWGCGSILLAGNILYIVLLFGILFAKPQEGDKEKTMVEQTMAGEAIGR